jgi:hypothetical protein
MRLVQVYRLIRLINIALLSLSQRSKSGFGIMPAYFAAIYAAREDLLSFQNVMSKQGRKDTTFIIFGIMAFTFRTTGFPCLLFHDLYLTLPR